MNSTRCLFNLATENALYNREELISPKLLFWKNENCVELGKNLRTEKVCNYKKIIADRVEVARRCSGGEAFYYGKGSFCYSLILPKELKDLPDTATLEALKDIGVPSPRIDLKRKIYSGENNLIGALYPRKEKDRVAYQGALFFSQKATPKDYLIPNPNYSNIMDIQPTATVEKFTKSLSEILRPKFKEIDHQVLEEKMLHSRSDVKLFYEQMSTYNWRYGPNLAFTHTVNSTFPWGQVEICFKVEDDLIKNAIIYSDSLHPDFIDNFNLILIEPDEEFSLRGWNNLCHTMEVMCFHNTQHFNMVKDISTLINSYLSS